MIPDRARRILDFIGEIEAPRGYGDVYAPNRKLLARDLESMTIDEVIRWQRWVTQEKGSRSSAAGRYQFLRKTLEGLKRQLGLAGSERLDANMQDRLAFELMVGRGWSRFVNGSLGVEDFALSLAKEWASLPVLDTAKGQQRVVHRGESYYASDGLNKALTKADDFERLLRVEFNEPAVHARPVEPRNAPAAPVTAPEPKAAPRGWWGRFWDRLWEKLGF